MRLKYETGKPCLIESEILHTNNSAKCPELANKYSTPKAQTPKKITPPAPDNKKIN